MSESTERPDDGFNDIRAKLAAAMQLSSDGGTAPTPALAGSVDDVVAHERGVASWLRSRSTPLRLVFGVAAVMLAAVLGALKVRVDLGVYPQLRAALELLLPLLLTFVALSTWLRPLHRPPPTVRLDAPLLVLLLVVLPALTALLPTAHGAHPASLAGVGPDLAKRAIGCLVYGCALGIPVGLLVVALGRRESNTLLATTAGAAAGAIGLWLHCPLTARIHLALAHSTMPLVGAMAALAVVLLARRIRRRASGPRR